MSIEIHMSWPVMQALANRILKIGISREWDLLAKRMEIRRKTRQNNLISERRSNEEQALRRKEF